MEYGGVIYLGFRGVPWWNKLGGGMGWVVWVVGSGWGEVGGLSSCSASKM